MKSPPGTWSPSPMMQSMSDLPRAFAALSRSLPDLAEPWSGEGRQAGVLVSLTHEDEPEVLLGRRARHLKLHPGEIAFPGGKREAEDAGPWDTALREAEEEVGIAPSQVLRIGRMPYLLTRHGFEVWPCIGLVPAGLTLRVDPGEFDSVFHAPLRAFADHSIFELSFIEDGGPGRWVPHYQLGDDNIWGVTAAVLAQLANLLYDAGFDLKRNWGQDP